VRKACLFSDEISRPMDHFTPAAAARHKGRLYGSCIPIVLLLTAAMLLHAAPDQELLPSYGKLPLAFEENRGQAPAGVSYLSRTRSGVVFLRPGSVALESDGGKRSPCVFVGAGAASAPTGEQKLPGITSYLVGDEGDWVRDIPNYASVRYVSVYPGIDACFMGTKSISSTTFVLNPGANPETDPDRV